jgi:hypothetical protein
MDPERRRTLEQKRRELQQRIQLRERLRWAQPALDFMAAHGVPYELVWDDNTLTNWIVEHFPNVGYSVLDLDWSLRPDAVRGPDWVTTDAEDRAWLEQLAAEQGLGDCDVFLVTDSEPDIRVRFSDVVRHPEIMRLLGWGRVACKSGGWLIESKAGWWWARARRAE